MFFTLSAPSIVLFNKWRDYRFSHKNSLYTPLNGESFAVISCDITLDSSKVLLKKRMIIVYQISRLIKLEDYEVKLILSAGTHSTEQFKS